MGVNGTPSSREELHLLVWVATAHRLFFIFLLCLHPPPLNPCRNVFGLKTNIVLRCFWGLMKNRVLVSVGWPAQQMGCWSTMDWEAKNTSCMVQRQVKKRYREPSTEEKKSLLMCFFSRAAGPLFNPVRSGIWYHFFPEGEQVSARPRFCILTCVAHDIR